MKNYLLKVENMLKIYHIFQDNLTQYQGSKGHSATSDGFLLSMKGSSLMKRLPFPSFFFDLMWQTMLPIPTASFQQGTMVLWMMVVHPARSLLFKSMKHCSQGSSSCVKNANTGNQWNTAFREAALVSKMQTPAITLWFPEHRFKENFYLGIFIKEKRFAWRSTQTPARSIICGWQILWPLIIISVRGTGLMRRTMIAQIMTSNYVTKA
jgi:hypothetical protein